MECWFVQFLCKYNLLAWHIFGELLSTAISVWVNDITFNYGKKLFFSAVFVHLPIVLNQLLRFVQVLFGCQACRWISYESKMPETTEKCGLIPQGLIDIKAIIWNWIKKNSHIGGHGTNRRKWYGTVLNLFTFRSHGSKVLSFPLEFLWIDFPWCYIMRRFWHCLLNVRHNNGLKNSSDVLLIGLLF